MKKLLALTIVLWAGSVFAASGDIKSVAVVDGTLLTGIDGNGWVLAVTFDTMATTGTGDPSKISLSVSGPGYANASAITRPDRTVGALAVLRKPCPPNWVTATSYAAGARTTNGIRFYSTTAGGTSGATAPTHTSGSVSDGGVTWTYLGDASQNSPPFEWYTVASGADAVVYYTLDQRIFSGETITAINIQSGAYVATISSASKTDLANVTNGSTLGHFRPNCGWHMVPWTRNGNTIHCEVVATHPFGENKRQVESVRFRITDTAAASVTQLVQVMSKSTLNTQGNPVPVYAADIDVSSLADGLVYVDFEAYPFRGDVTFQSNGTASSTVIVGRGDATPAATASVHYDTAKRIPLFKEATYGSGDAEVFAYVDPTSGVNASGVVSTVAATASASPFQSIAYALWQTQVYRNTNYTRNNTSGVRIRLKAGTHDSLGVAGSITPENQTKGQIWSIIERDPAVTDRSTVIIAATSTASYRYPHRRLKISGVTISAATSTVIFLDHYNYDYNVNWGTGFVQELWVDNCDIQAYSGGELIIKKVGGVYYTNNTMVNLGQEYGNAGNYRSAIPLFCGNIVNAGSVGSGIKAVTVASGNKFYGASRLRPANGVTRLDLYSSTYAWDTPIGIANTFNASTQFMSLWGETALNGGSWVLNLHETLVGGGANKGGEWFADANLSPGKSLYFIANSIPSEGANFIYNEAGTTAVYKAGVAQFNACDDWNSKGDFYGTPSAARTGAFSARYHVDYYGQVVYAATLLTPSPTNLAGECLGRAEVWSGSRNVIFDAGQTGNDSGVGGDYRPLYGAAVLNRVPSGKAPLPFDLRGMPYRNDGTDSSGAFQRSIIQRTGGHF